MTDVNEESNLQTLLNVEHIRQHLIKVGLINKYGQIISKEDYESTYKHHSKRRNILNKNLNDHRKYQKFVYRPLTAVNIQYPKEDIKDSKQYQQFKNISTYQSKQKNKSQTPTRLSSPNQSTRVKNIFTRRSISPKIIPINNRCIITMIYYASQTLIDYERNLFEPEGDEIIVMQQHCGGENLIVYKGSLKPNEKFQFESRRHQGYPFALTFYVNGLIDNRLSICCESRYKHNVRIGGKRGLFGIITVQKSKACKRCRHEQRIKRIAELKAQKALIRPEISTPEPNITRPTSPEPPASSEERHEPPRRLSFSIPNEKELSTLEKNSDRQRRSSIASSGKDNNPWIKTRDKQTNTDFEKDFVKIDQKKAF